MSWPSPSRSRSKHNQNKLYLDRELRISPRGITLALPATNGRSHAHPSPLEKPQVPRAFGGSAGVRFFRESSIITRPRECNASLRNVSGLLKMRQFDAEGKTAIQSGR